MLPMDLLRAFVSVVDAGGFTRAGAQVHRAQSTVSQQIKRLEDELGHTLLARDGRTVRPTAEGERLLGYARRILALAGEARAALGAAPSFSLRLGIPDDIAPEALTRAIGAFAHDRPEVRMSVRCAVSRDLAKDLARGELDLALHKREPGSGPAFATWPEQPVWIAGAQALGDISDPVPLVAFAHGCLYRDRAIHALERAGRAWRVAYESPNLMGLQAALGCGLGIALLERRSATAGHRILPPGMLPDIPPTELALALGPGTGSSAQDQAARDLAVHLAAACSGLAGARDCGHSARNG